MEYEIEEKKHRIREVKEDLFRRNIALEDTVTEMEQQMIRLRYEYIQTLEAEGSFLPVIGNHHRYHGDSGYFQTVSKWDQITEIDYL